MRWIQRVDPETGKSRFVEAPRVRSEGITIHGQIEPFVSPIDGTVISDRKQYREHCRKHGVVPAQEYSPEYYARKQKEREALRAGKRTAAETMQLKRELWEQLHR